MKLILPLLPLAFTVSLYSNPDLIEEHAYGGLPSSGDLMFRTAYVLDYDAERKTPRWVAYHLTEDYRRTPKRTGKWKSYRNDPDRTGEPREADLLGCVPKRDQELR